jgi:hypothetical protein
VKARAHQKPVGGVHAAAEPELHAASSLWRARRAIEKCTLHTPKKWRRGKDSGRSGGRGNGQLDERLTHAHVTAVRDAHAMASEAAAPVGALLAVLLPGRADTPDARRELQRLLRAHAAALDPAPETLDVVDVVQVPILASEAAAAAALHRRPEQATTEVDAHEVPAAAMELITVAASGEAADALDRVVISSREAASDDVVNSEVPIAATETTAAAAAATAAADGAGAAVATAASRSAHPPGQSAATPKKAKFEKPPKANKNNKAFDFSKYPQRHVALQVRPAAKCPPRGMSRLTRHEGSKRAE